VFLINLPFNKGYFIQTVQNFYQIELCIAIQFVSHAIILCNISCVIDAVTRCNNSRSFALQQQVFSQSVPINQTNSSLVLKSKGSDVFGTHPQTF
jgi:hypothetical protein